MAPNRHRHLAEREIGSVANVTAAQRLDQIVEARGQVAAHKRVRAKRGEQREQFDDRLAHKAVLVFAVLEHRVAHLFEARQHELARVAQQLANRQQRAVHRLGGAVSEFNNGVVMRCA